MIKDVLPIGLVNSFKLYDQLAKQAYDLPFKADNQSDLYFKEGNIHSLLYALKNI